jgi:hypothetical protein
LGKRHLRERGRPDRHPPARGRRGRDDDIFLAARAAGIKSVFSGGDANYAALTTADFRYAASVSDAMVVQQAIALPDVAVTTMRFFGLPPLEGHTSPAVSLAVNGPTGTVLTNLFQGGQDEVAHPRIIERYLKLNTFPASGDDYGHSRAAMLSLLK